MVMDNKDFDSIASMFKEIEDSALLRKNRSRKEKRREVITTEKDKKLFADIAGSMFEQKIEDIASLQNYRYCICLDIGGGNCSAAILEPGEAEPHTLAVLGPGEAEPHALKMCPRGATSVWSNIGYEKRPGEEGKIKIGKQAQNMNYRYSNYKRELTNLSMEEEVEPDNYTATGVPEEDEKCKRTVEELTRDFVRVMFENIRNYKENVALKMTRPKDILLIVGHPSGTEWMKKEVHENLAGIVREATGVETVLTTAESNSAILYALKMASVLGNANKILIVDLGAYSADFTFIDRKKLDHKYASIPLGGKDVDKNLAEIILKACGYERDRFDPDFDLHYESRLIKEMHWPEGERAQNVSIKLKSGGSVTVTISKEQFDAAVKEMPIPMEDGDEAGYTGILDRFIRSAKEEHGINVVDFVLVTGGAARMTPALETIRNTANALWKLPQEKVWPENVSDEMMDNAVPFGGLYFYQKALQVLDTLPGVWQDLKKASEKIVGPMASEASKALLDYLMPNVIEPVLRENRDAPEDRSFEQLEAAMKARLKEPEHLEKIKKIIGDAAGKAAEQKKPVFQKIIDSFLDELFQRGANEAGWKWDTEVKTDIDLSRILFDDVASAFFDAYDWGDFLVDLFLLTFRVVAYACKVIGKGLRFIFMSEEEFENYEREQERQKVKEEKKQRKKEYKKLRDASDRRKIYKEATREDNKEKIRQNLEHAIRPWLQEKCSEDGFGIPRTYLQHLAEDIRKAVYTGRMGGSV